MTSRDERLGLFFAGLCALNGAFVPAVAKLTTFRATPLFVAAASNLFAALGAAAILAWRGDLGVLAQRSRGPRLLLIGALGTAAAHLLFYLGASRATAVEVALCVQIEPAYSLLLSWLALGHRPTGRRVVATVLLLFGIGLAIGGAGLAASSGTWFLLATPLCWQLSHLVVLRGLVGTPPMVLAGARYVFGGALLALAWLLVEGGATGVASGGLVELLPLLAVQGIVLGLGGTLWWYQAIARLDLTRATAIVVPSIPLLSLAVSFVLLGEVATARQWIGLLLTAAGIVAFVTTSHPSGMAGTPVRR